MENDLASLQRKIADVLMRRPECTITQPRELRVLQALSKTEMADFAREWGWNVIRRVGGRQFQFYNDTYTRLHA